MRRTEKLYEETMTKNFPNLAKEIDFQVQEEQRGPDRINLKWPT